MLKGLGNSDLCSSLGLVREPVMLKGKDSDKTANISSTNEVAEEVDNCQKRSSLSGSRLVHQTSDPLVLETAIKAHSREMKEVNKKSDNNGRRSKLLRTPSLPPSVGREEKFQVCDHRPNKQTSKVLPVIFKFPFIDVEVICSLFFVILCSILKSNEIKTHTPDILALESISPPGIWQIQTPVNLSVCEILC